MVVILLLLLRLWFWLYHTCGYRRQLRSYACSGLFLFLFSAFLLIFACFLFACKGAWLFSVGVFFCCCWYPEPTLTGTVEQTSFGVVHVFCVVRKGGCRMHCGYKSLPGSGQTTTVHRVFSSRMWWIESRLGVYHTSSSTNDATARMDSNTEQGRGGEDG